MWPDNDRKPKNHGRSNCPNKREDMTMSNTKTKPIKAVLGLTKLGAKDILPAANAVHDGIFGDPTFAPMPPPIDKATLEEAIVTSSLLSTQAADGSKKAIAARNHQGDILI